MSCLDQVMWHAGAYGAEICLNQVDGHLHVLYLYYHIFDLYLCRLEASKSWIPRGIFVFPCRSLSLSL